VDNENVLPLRIHVRLSADHSARQRGYRTESLPTSLITAAYRCEFNQHLAGIYESFERESAGLPVQPQLLRHLFNRRLAESRGSLGNTTGADGWAPARAGGSRAKFAASPRQQHAAQFLGRAQHRVMPGVEFGPAGAEPVGGAALMRFARVLR